MPGQGGGLDPTQGRLFPPAVELGASDGAAGAAGLNQTRRRILWFAILAFGWGALIFLRQAHLQIGRRPFFEEKARIQLQRTVVIRASRGRILDRRGRELAISAPVDSICAMPAEVADPEAAGDILARIIGLPRAELVRKLRARRGFCWIQRQVEPEVAEQVRALNLRGIYFQKESKRYYPKGRSAAHLVGAVDLDQIGQLGVEQAREDQLQGKPGLMVVSADARRRSFAGALAREPEPGLNVVLTVDERIQHVAERELSLAIQQTGALAGSIVVLEPGTGALLAVANHPTFNPNEPVRSPGDLEARRNFAVHSSFEPGSTFKLVTIAGALEEKLTQPRERLDCQWGAIRVGGRRIRDHKPFGVLTVEEILAHSSDVGAIKLGMRLGNQRLSEYMQRFGFGRPTGVELHGEARGLTKPAARWSRVSIGAISMGQEVGVTALQLAQAVGVIANNGLLVPPRVVEAVFRTGEKPVAVPRRAGRQVVSPETAIQVRKMMEVAILSGTGKLARLEGYTAGGKTGTAQKIDPRTGTYSRRDFVASFVGLAPLSNPAIVVAIILDSPRGLHSGGGVAAPIFPRVAGEVLRYVGVPQELPVSPRPRPRRIPPDERLLAEVDDFNPERPEEAWAPGPALASVGPRSSPAWPASAGVLLAVADQAVPDFYGKSLRAVVEQATGLGLEVELRGNGVARRQIPAAGSALPAGSRVLIEFER